MRRHGFSFGARLRDAGVGLFEQQARQLPAHPVRTTRLAIRGCIRGLRREARRRQLRRGPRARGWQGRRRRVTDPRTASGDLVIIGVLGQSAVIDELVRAGKIERGRSRRTVGGVPPDRRRAARSPTCRARSSSSAPIAAAPCSAPTICPSRSASRPGTGSPTCRCASRPNVYHHRRLASRPAQGASTAASSSTTRTPAFSDWAQKQFGGVNSKMYVHVFELLLRLKGNYLWPAMWAPKRVQRRRSAEHDPRRRHGRGHGHLAPRADDARAERVASQQGQGRHRRQVELRAPTPRTCASSGAAASNA